MYYELALISVLIAAAYWGFYFLRTARARTYGLMQLAAAFGSALGLYHRREGGPMILGVLGAIGVGMGACLLLIAPLLRGLARRLASSERFGIALRLLDVAEVLAPGSGVAEEKHMYVALRRIRAGDVEPAIADLTERRARERPDARLEYDEQITMLYLAADRWDEAIAYAEAHLLPRAETGTALGLAPAVWVELISAYGSTGNLEQAGRMLVRFEEVAANRPEAAMWVHGGRMTFLAHAGRVAAVEALVAPQTSRHMSERARTYWLGVARERSGDARGAETAYRKARAQTRGRRRLQIDRALERLATLRAIELTPGAMEIVAQIETQAPPVVKMRARPRPPWATRALTASMFVVAATIALALGDSSDLGVLVRAGAMVRGFIHAGEWWRLVSCNFIHVGGLHLLVNTLGLWFLCRECEYMFGPSRTVTVFALAGVAGFIASYLASPAGVSAGASGAIFGLLGAVFVELTLQKSHHRAAWSRGMWGSLAVIVVGQIGIDFMYAGVTDQYAHGGGALFGALLGAVLSPHAKWAKVGLYASRAIAVVFVGVCIVAAILVVRTPLAKSLGTPDHEYAIENALTVRAPAGWSMTDSLEDPDDLIEIRFASSNAVSPFEVFTTAEQDRVRKQFARIDIATEHVVPLPTGWTGTELAITPEDPDPVGGRQHYRLIIAGKQFPSGTVLVSIEVAETIARAAPDLFSAILASVAAK